MLNQVLSLLLLFTLLSGGNFSSPPSIWANSPVSPIHSTSPLDAQLLLEEESIHPGQPFWAAIHLKIQPDWHAYWKNPGGVGFPTSVTWNLPSGFEVEEVQWPYPEKWESLEGIRYGYAGELTLLAKITPPLDFVSQKPVKIEASVNWLVCSDMACLPGEEALSVEVPVVATAPRLDPRWKEVFSLVREKLARKPVDLRVERDQKDLILSFTIDTPLKTKVKEMYFCPEMEGVINPNGKLQFEILPHSLSSYRVRIPTAVEETEEPVLALKGTLVMVKEDEKHPSEAVEVEAPLEEEDGTVAMADASEHKYLKKITAEKPLTIGWALAFAFLGGMILNLMPCVLPVISLKIFSFIKMARESRWLIFKHGVLFCTGVLVSFWILAAVLITLQAYGHSVGWGFQLQEPIFVALLAAVLFVFGLSLFGVFEIGTKVASWAGQTESDASQSSHQLAASFFSGVLATAVATPCTGPFLGSAVGFAMTLTPPLSLLIFTALGMGMAFPYLLFSLYPALLRFVPKPGKWMITFKEILGFCMMGSCLWLAWVFGAQTDQMALFMLFIGLFFLALGCWAYGKWGNSLQSQWVRWFGRGLMVLSFLLGVSIIYQAATAPQLPVETGHEEIALAHPQSSSDWEPYSAARVAELQAQGIPVFVDFTAKWCLICQTNHLVLSGKEANRRFEELGVVKMKADWTKKDPMIAKELQKFGRSGVPLYLFYGKDAQNHPEVLPQVLTPEIVLQAMEENPKK